MPRFLKVLFFVFASLVFLFLAAVLLIQTPYAKKKILTSVENYAEQNYNLRITAEKLDYHFFPLTIRADKFRLHGGEGNRFPFLETRFVQLDIPYASFWADDFVVQQLILDAPRLDTDHPPKPKIPKTQKEGTFSIQEVLITGGSLQYARQKIQDLKVDAQLEPDGIRVKRLWARLDEIEINAYGEITHLQKPDYAIHYRVKGKTEAVSRIFPQIPSLAGMVHTSGSVRGSAGAYQIEGSLNTNAISVEGSAPMTASGTYNVDSSNIDQPYQIHLNWSNLPLGLLSKFTKSIPPVASSSNGILDYAGTTDFWQARAKLQTKLSPTPTRGLALAGGIQGELDGGIFRLQPSRLALGSTTVDLSGDFNKSSLQLKALAVVRKPAELSFLARQLRKVPGSYVANATLQGPYKNIRVDANVNGTSEEMELQVSGSYFTGSQLFNADFHAQGDAMYLNRVYPAGLRGNLQLDGNASGNFTHPVLHASIRGQDVEIKNVALGNLTVQADSDGHILKVDANIPAYSATANANLRFSDKTYRLEANAANLKTEQFSSFLPQDYSDVTGTVSANLVAEGNVSHWQTSTGELRIEEASFTRNDLQASIQPGSTVRLVNQKLAADMNIQITGGSFHVTGSLPITGKKDLMLHAVGQGDLKIVSMFTDKIVSTGIVSLNVTASGNLTHPVYSGTVESENFTVSVPEQELTLKDGKLQASFSGQQIAVTTIASFNGSPMELKGIVPLSEQPGNIHLTLQNFPVSTLAKKADVSGTVGLQLDATGTGMKLASWSGDLTVTPTNIIVAGNKIQSEPVRVHMDMGAAELKPLHLKAAKMLDITAEGRVNFTTGEIGGKVHGKTDLVILSTFTPDVQAGGDLNSSFVIAGTLTKPTFEGFVQLQNGTLRKVDTAILLEQINLSADLQKERITIQKFDAQMGGGDITGGGDVTLGNWQPTAMNLWLKAKNVGMNYPEDLRSQINADLKITNAQEDYLISGKVFLARSVYREDLDPRSRLVNSLLNEKAALSPNLASRSKITLDLQIQSLEDFQMKNNLGKLQAGTDLRVTGTLLEPRISGRIRIREGSKIFFEGNEFEVQRGVVDFYGRKKITPVLDVQLYTIATDSETREEYEITIPLSGSIDDLDDRDPVSSPALDPNQIYFLLLTGRVDAQLSRAGSLFFQKQLAAYITGRVFSDVQRKIARAFGLDRMEIQPELISSETTPGAKLVLGKDFSSSLSLIYATSLTESREQTWIANYKLTRNLNVRFVDQDDGSYTANIRHLVRFGTGQTTRSLTRNISRLPHQNIKEINIVNQSPLSEDEIRKSIGIKTGQEFDFWVLQDKVDKLKQNLQDLGYLFPSVTAEETELSRGSVRVTLDINARQRAEMTFEGSEVSKDQINKYKTWWREGFSEEAVLELIREDLKRSHWLEGYHKVSVKREKHSTNEITQYHYRIVLEEKYANPQITFIGTKQYPAEELGKDLFPFYDSGGKMASEAIHGFVAFQKKVAALYVKKGFLETKIEAGEIDYNKNGMVERKVLITEGPQSRITDVVISNGGRFPEELQKKLKMQVGKVYDPQALAEDEMAIQEYYEQKGYRNFKVESEITKADGNADLILNYQVQPGGVAKVASIQINGNAHTQTKLIEKRLNLKRGDIITHDKLANAQKNLYDLRVFHQATVQAKETAVPDQYELQVDVIEIKHYELTYGLRYDTEKSIGGEIQLADLSLFGTGQSMSLYTRVNKVNQLYRAVYHSPTLSGLKWKTLLSASYESGELSLRETNTFGLAEGHRAIFSFQRQRKVWDPFILLTGYEFESLRTRPLNVPLQPFDSYNISRVMATVLSDTRDDPLNAKRGQFISFDFSYAPKFLGSDVRYVKNYSQYFRFQPFGRTLWASAVRFGVASSLEQRLITERFLAGGSYTIRGFQKDQVGPKDALGNPIGGESMFVLNQELRFPIYKWMGGAVFYDAGNVYETYGDLNPFKLRHSAGFGLRFDSPFGVARIDLGFNLHRRDNEPRTVFHFGLGQAF